MRTRSENGEMLAANAIESRCLCTLTRRHKELIPGVALFGMVIVDAVRALRAVVFEAFFQDTLLHLVLHRLVDHACSGLRQDTTYISL